LFNSTEVRFVFVVLDRKRNRPLVEFTGWPVLNLEVWAAKMVADPSD
jgi:hypothetical protein